MDLREITKKDARTFILKALKKLKISFCHITFKVLSSSEEEFNIAVKYGYINDTIHKQIWHLRRDVAVLEADGQTTIFTDFWTNNLKKIAEGKTGTSPKSNITERIKD